MISSLADYLAEVDKRNITLKSTTSHWFRGQGRAAWGLVPSLYRGDWDPCREREMHRDFRLRASLSVGERPNSYLGWMFVMQHHGLPTRLLDWTESSLIGLYFAVGNFEDSSDAAVWIMHPWNLNELSTSLALRTVPPLDAEIEEAYRLRNVDTTTGALDIKNDRPAAVRPSHMTRRISAQRGQFTIHGQSTEGLEELPRIGKKLRDDRIVISGTKKLDILKQLHVAGVSRSTLFPDLDGLAAEVKSRYSPQFLT